MRRALICIPCLVLSGVLSPHWRAGSQELPEPSARAVTAPSDVSTPRESPSPLETSRAPQPSKAPLASRPRPLRALWITRWDYKTEADVRRAIDWSRLVGFQHVLFQVRGRADAFYRSELEPWAEELGGRDPGFDPLSVALDEARQQGIELHAWINLLPGWKGGALPKSPRHLARTRPEWFLTDRRGALHLTSPADYTILNPCLPEVRRYLAQVVSDIATRYPVDGLHLDYVRFLGRDVKSGVDFPYDTRSVELFRRFSSSSPAGNPEAWDRWRRLSVDTLLFRVVEAARAARPGLRISVAAIPDLDRAREGLFQDVVKWKEQGWVDDVIPMSYERDLRSWEQTLQRIASRLGTDRVYPGVGLHLHKSAESVIAQLQRSSAMGFEGYAAFAFTQLFPSPSHEFSSAAPARELRGQMRRSFYRLHRSEGLQREGEEVSLVPASLRTRPPGEASPE